ncbi:MAG: TIGR04149 family rSAM-modified RiPP [Bacteroides graminisolvens]|jgi:natural product precursor|nr:TIGR04149 family rSAM-modified RiPP [Bacteroides graminisolvens]
MKKLSKLRLTSLSESNLQEKEMSTLTGGDCSCGCGCLYANNGGSSTGENMVANSQNGLHSSSYKDSCSCGATGYYVNGGYHVSAGWYSYNAYGN